MKNMYVIMFLSLTSSVTMLFGWLYYFVITTFGMGGMITIPIIVSLMGLLCYKLANYMVEKGML